MLPKDQINPAAARPKAASDKDAKAAARTTGTKSTARAAPRKPAGARPSNDLQQRIQQRAYELWEHEGRPQGREHAHWQQAERELAGRSAGGRA
jgi:Protein of unknown function (DUF2934)